MLKKYLTIPPGSGFLPQGPKLVDLSVAGTEFQGWSTSISSDGNTAIVGGYGVGGNIGAGWIYTRSNGVWTQQAKLVGDNVIGTSEQGGSVAISSDGLTAAVGGFNDNGGIGAVWVFTSSGGVWSQQGAKLTASDAIGTSSQGRSVSLNANGNTLMVGGSYDNSHLGAAWVYTRNSGTWTQQGAKLAGTGSTGTDVFQGCSVSLSADGNTAFIGAYGDASGKGAAWQFFRSGGIWAQVGAKITASDETGAGEFGYSVSMCANASTAIIGAMLDNGQIGAAWIFSSSGSGAGFTQSGSKHVGTGIGASTPGVSLQGSAVSISSDGSTAAVGGWGDQNYAGAIWIYTGSGGVWTQLGNKVDTAGTSNLGKALALSSDGMTIIAGEPNDISGSTYYGASIVFSVPYLTPTVQATNLLFTNTTSTSTTTSWTDGNGTSRLVFIHQGSTPSPITPLPVDLATYTASAVYASGSQIGTTGWYCIYNGTGNTVNITGLTKGTAYQLMTEEYNGMTGTQKYLTTTATGNPASLTTPTPTISYSGTLSPLTTIYGAASSTDNFTVSGNTLAAAITVTAPAGFEVSASPTSGFASAILIGAAGTVASTTVYVRLTALAAASATSYAGNIALSSIGSPTNTGPAISGLVSPRPLTVSLTDSPAKTYGQSLSNNLVAGNVPTGYNGDAITGTTEIPNSAGYSITVPAGSTYLVTPSLATGNSSFLASNYTITYSAFSGTVTAAPLVITAANAARPYGTVLGTGAGSMAFTSATLENGETIGSVTMNYISGNNATDNAGSYANSAVPSAATGGTFTASNYTIMYVVGNLSVTPAPLSITGNTFKYYGTVLVGGSGSTSFSPLGLKNGETVYSVTIAYGSGAAGTDPVATYNSASTPSAASGGTFAPSNYSITYISGIIYVSPAPLYITAATYKKNYGTALTSGPGFTNVSSTGLRNSETIGSVNLVFGTGATATSSVGTYVNQSTPSAATGGTFTASNYTITYYKANIVVSKDSLFLTANVVTKNYGVSLIGAAAQTGYSYAGLVNGETVGTVTLAYGAGSGATDAGGTYTGSVTPSLATGGTFTASNYVISYLPANLVVVARNLAISVTPDATSKSYGASLTGGPGSLSFSAIGLQNGETIGSVTIAYSAGGGATAAVGNYPSAIIGSAATGGTFHSGNYSITYIVSDLNVTARALLITANSISKVYGTTLTGAAGSTAFTSSGLQNSETLASVSIAFGTGAAASASVGAYTGSILASAPIGGSSFTSSNYSITYVSGMITIGTAPLAITAIETDKIYGAALTGVAGSVAFTSSGLQNGETIGSVTLAYGTGSLATAAVGTYTGMTTPSLATGGTFAAPNYAITYNQGNIVIAAAPLLITASPVSKIYGLAISGSSGSTAFNATGLRNSETIGSVTAAYGAGSVATDAVATYSGSVIASAATGGNFTASNYLLTYAAGSLTVTPHALLITANSISKIYGAILTGAAGSTAFTSSGLQNGETLASVTIAYGSGSAAASPVGTYAGSVAPSAVIGGSTFAASNYTETYASGTLIIGASPLTLTAIEADKIYGTALTGVSGSTSFTSSGLVNSETIGSLTLAYATGSPATAAVGTYTGMVTPSLATGGTFTAANYTITYNAGNIVVAQAPLIITAAAISKIYGNTLIGAAGSPAFLPTGLKNSESVGSVTIAYGAGSAATDAAGTYSGSVSASAATGGTFAASNYLLSYGTGILTVSSKSLIITASSVSKTYGSLLTGASGQTAFTSTGLIGGESLNTVTFAYGTGALATANVATYPGSVTASLPVGSAGFNAANYTISFVAGDIIIGAAPLAITASSVTKTFGVALIGAIGTSVFTSSGLVNGETIGTVTLSLGAGSAATAAVKTYVNAVTTNSAIGGTFTASNYSITYNTSNIIVVPAALSVTAIQATKIYGATLSGGAGSALFTWSGLMNGDAIGSVTIAYGSGSAATAPVGVYASSVSVSVATGGSFIASNYTLTYTAATLTVTPAPLAITTGTVSKLYGATLTGSAGFTAFTSSGLQNSESIGSVTTDYGTGSAAAVAVGTYAGQSGSSLATGGNFTFSNYSITYNTAAIVVNQAPLTVTATGPSKVYGTALAAAISTANFFTTTLVNGETVVNVLLTPDDTGQTYNTPTGSNYVISPSAATGGGTFLASNYAITYVPFTGQVTALPLIITATGPGKTYGTVLSASSSTTKFSTTLMAAGESITSVMLNVDAAGQSATIASGSAYLVTPSAAVGNSAYNSANYTVSYIPFNSLVTPAPLAITAIAVSKVYGTALSGSSGSVSFTTAGIQNHETVGSVTSGIGSGGTATASVGTYPGSVTAALATGGTFLAANYTISYVPATLAVIPAPLTVTSAIIYKTYGTTLSSASGSTAFTSSGLQNSESIGSASSVVGQGSAATAAVGTYTGSSGISSATGGTFTAGNYAISYIAGNLVVGKASLAILALDVTKNYGSLITGASSSTAFTASGLQNSETIGSLTVSYGTGAAATASVGTYAGSILANLATSGTFSLSNYNVSYYPGNIIVAPAALVVTPAGVNKLYGVLLSSTPGSTAFTVTGLQNAETSATITLSYGAGAGAASSAGTYTGSVTGSLLTGGSFFASNYSITYKPAILIVGTQMPTVLVVSQPDCSTALGTLTVQNYNAAFIYTISAPGFTSQAGATFTAPAGTYTMTALAPLSFTSPASFSFTINPRPPIPNLVITNPLEVNAPSVVNIELAAITALSDPNLSFTYFKDINGMVALADPAAITVTGVYYIKGTNSYGCSSPVKAVFVYIDPAPKLVITNPKAVNDPSTVDITVPAVTAGSTPGLIYTYFTDSLGIIPLTDPTNISVPGTYYVKGTNAGGNYLIKKVIVVINYVIFVPNIFTPNGDGKNDRFEIVGLQHFPGSTLMIYNRWGNVLYHSDNYQNTWDGGGQIPGTYYYVLLLKKGSESTVYKGWVQILH